MANGKPFRWIHFNNAKWKKGFELVAVEDLNSYFMIFLFLFGE